MKLSSHYKLFFFLQALVFLTPMPGIANMIKLEPNPGPGVDTYKSDQYRVELWDGARWIESYTYMTDNPSGSDTWSDGAIHFTSFGTGASVKVRITRLTGTLAGLSISPASRHTAVSMDEGKATLELAAYDKIWITAADDSKSSTLLIFADPPKSPVPNGARYYKPGIHFAGDHDAPTYAPASGEVVYLDAGAWVKGNFDMRQCRGAHIMGPGVLSGELWNVNDHHNPWMIRGQRDALVTIAGRERLAVNSYQDFTVVRAPAYNFGDVHADRVNNVKLISPWRHSTDGFQVIPSAEGPTLIDHCFAFVGDDVFFPRENVNGDMEIRNCFVASTNNSFFQICYWGATTDHHYSMYAHDLDLKSYLNSKSAVFKASINNRPDTGVRNMRFENLNIEGSLPCPLILIENRDYFWPNQTPRPNTRLGNTYNFVFRNVALAGTQGKMSTILGLDEHNGHHDYLFQHVSINGTVLDSRNYAEYIKVNRFTSNIRFASSADERPVVIAPKAK